METIEILHSITLVLAVAILLTVIIFVVSMIIAYMDYSEYAGIFSCISAGILFVIVIMIGIISYHIDIIKRQQVQTRLQDGYTLYLDEEKIPSKAFSSLDSKHYEIEINDSRKDITLTLKK